jgi:hypothetical protein
MHTHIVSNVLRYACVEHYIFISLKGSTTKPTKTNARSAFLGAWPHGDSFQILKGGLVPLGTVKSTLSRFM